MITLRTFIEQEQPRINAALAEAAAELPVSIMPIAQYAMGNGGKRLRPLLTVLVARLLGYADNDTTKECVDKLIPEIIPCRGNGNVPCGDPAP